MIYREIIETNKNILFNSHGTPDHIIKWHYHPQYELHLIKDTSGTAYIGDYVGPFKPGHLVLLGPNLPHNWISDLKPGMYSRERSWALVFDHDFVEQILTIFSCDENIHQLLQQSSRGVQFNGNTHRITNLMQEFQTAVKLGRNAIFLNLIQEMADHQDRTQLASIAILMEATITSGSKIENILDYININSDKDLTLKTMGETFSITSTSFSRHFKNKTGKSFITYINKLRITKACLLLQSTELSIKEISQTVGYANSSYFNKIFLEHKNITPKQFRKTFTPNEQQSKTE